MSEKDFLDLQDLSHLEQIDTLFKNRLEPYTKAQNANAVSQANWNKLIGTIALLLVGFGSYMFIELNRKASKEEQGWYLQKAEFIRSEYFDSQRLKEAFADPKRAEYLLRDMNEHRLDELGYSMTPRGPVTINKDPKN